MESLYDNCYDYDYTRPKAVVFPPPPPTTNVLSPDERARLLRSSKKIARVLGATPRFIDFEVEDAKGNDNTFAPSPPSIYRTSFDTIDSISSCSTTLTSTSYTSASTSATSVSTSHSLNRPRKPLPLAPLQDAWPTQKLFRLNFSLDTSLESIPASPLTPTLTPVPIPQPMSRTIPTRHKRSAPLDGSPSSSPSRGMSPVLNSSPPSPSFVIPSRAAARRRKLDRLRRTLGEDVPVRLIFPQTAESDSESESELSLSSSGKTSSEDDLITPDSSPVSPTSPLFDIEITKPEDEPIPRPSQRSPRKKKITNTRDSLVLPSKPPRATRTIKVPQATRPAPPPLTPSSSPNKKSSPRATAQSKPSVLFKVPSANPTSPSRNYEHPPIVHRRSHSGSSSNASTRLGLGVILEEKGESEWYESDDEDDGEFDFIREDEVLGAVWGWGGGSSVLYEGPVGKGKGMGRGLATSYGTCGYSKV